jgi:hypothetical protein
LSQKGFLAAPRLHHCAWSTWLVSSIQLAQIWSNLLPVYGLDISH